MPSHHHDPVPPPYQAGCCRAGLRWDARSDPTLSRAAAVGGGACDGASDWPRCQFPLRREPDVAHACVDDGGLRPVNRPGWLLVPASPRAHPVSDPAHAVFQRRIVEVPLRLGHPVWVDDPDFDIDNHLRRAALPSPGGMRELAEFAGDVASRQLDRHHPLWEMWIVEASRTGSSRSSRPCTTRRWTASRAPSSWASSSTSSPTRRSSRPSPSTPLTPGSRRTPNSSPRRWSRACSSRWASRGPSGARASPCSVSAGSANPSRPQRGAAPHRPAHQLQLSAERAAAGRVRSRQPRRCEAPQERDGHDRQRRRARHLHGALRRYLDAGDELPDIPLVAVVPVSVAPDLAAVRGANKVSAMFVALPVQEADPIKRLDLIHEGTRGRKRSTRHSGRHAVELGGARDAQRLRTASRFYSRMRWPTATVLSPTSSSRTCPVPSSPLPRGAEMLAGSPSVR